VENGDDAAVRRDHDRHRQERRAPPAKSVAVGKEDAYYYPERQQVEKEEERPINEVDYRDRGGPSLRYLWCGGGGSGDSRNCGDGGNGGDRRREEGEQAPLAGQQLYLGAEIGSDGCVYCVPGHAGRVLKCRPDDGGEAYLIGPRFAGKFKWLRGVRVGDIVYGLPCHSDSVLRIDVPNQEVTLLPIPYEEFYADDENGPERHRRQEWKYHGGTVSPVDGRIYCIPQSAERVLRIDPERDACELVGPRLEGGYKWYGGVVGMQDGAIYGYVRKYCTRVQNMPRVEATIPNDFLAVLRWGCSVRVRRTVQYGSLTVSVSSTNTFAATVLNTVKQNSTQLAFCITNYGPRWEGRQR